MVGWVKYGPDCWMMEGDGKCRAEAEARGLPANRDICIRRTQVEMDAESERKTWNIEFLHIVTDGKEVINERDKVLIWFQNLEDDKKVAFPRKADFKFNKPSWALLNMFMITPVNLYTHTAFKCTHSDRLYNSLSQQHSDADTLHTPECTQIQYTQVP